MKINVKQQTTITNYIFLLLIFHNFFITYFKFINFVHYTSCCGQDALLLLYCTVQWNSFFRLGSKEMKYEIRTRTRKIRAAGHVIEVLRLHLFLVSLTMIEVVEVGDNDRHRQGDRQHTSDRAQRAHDLPPDSHGPEAEGNERFHSRSATGSYVDSFVPRLENSVLGVVFLSCVSLPCRVECGATYAVLEAPM